MRGRTANPVSTQVIPAQSPYVLRIVTAALFCLVICLVTTASSRAAEPVSEFLQGLRSRGELDLALDYLTLMHTSPLLTEEVQPVFLLESGITFAQAVLKTSDPERQEQYREQARSALRSFVKQSPGHPRIIQGKTLLGELLLHDCSESAMERPPRTDAERQQIVRVVIGESRDYLQQSRDRYQEMWEQFPVYIPEDQPDVRKVKRAIEESLIRTQLDLAQCTYWEAQTWPEGTSDAQRLCAQAGLEFEAIHQRYRSQAGGLLARLWQARCFQEQGSEQGVRIALGIYAEILEHHGDSPTIVDLRDRALKFRLTCLNTEHRRDYQLVIQEGEAWLELASERAVSPVGVAIQWEICSALEQKAGMPGTSEEERLSLLQLAYRRAYPLTWIKGFYARQASQMMDRISPVLEAAGKSIDPREIVP